MKQIILTLLILISLSSIAQNGGQSPSSGSVLLQQLGYANGQAFVIISNKQSCTTLIEVSYTGSSQKVTVAGSATDTILITVPIGSKVKAKPLTGCAVNFDNGNVELTIIPASLPVKYLSTTVAFNGKGVDVQWITSEEEVNYYTLQESSDAKQWENTAMIFAGNGSYSYTDNSPSTYYRIASTDMDGHIEYSRIMKVAVQSNRSQLQAYPNPVVSTATVSLTTAGAAKISLYSITGVLVQQVPTNGQQTVKLDLSRMQAGMYYVTDGISSVKINKQ